MWVWMLLQRKREVDKSVNEVAHHRDLSAGRRDFFDVKSKERKNTWSK
jgi:hypothetical protein